MKKICFSGFTYSDNYISMHDQMVRSLKKFHPDIPYEYYDRKKCDALMKRNPKASLGALVAYIGEELSKDYDLVIHIDSDCIVTGDLNEVLYSSYDVASVRNNNEYGKAGFCYPGFTRINILTGELIGMQEYCNTGLHAVSNPKFWKDWQKASIAYANTCLLQEQDIMNDVFYSGKYNSLLLDSPDKPYFYGCSNSWGIKSHYESWKKMVIRYSGLFLNNKEVKILHCAGGEKLDGTKFDFDTMFTEEVREYVLDLIKG